MQARVRAGGRPAHASRSVAVAATVAACVLLICGVAGADTMDVGGGDPAEAIAMRAQLNLARKERDAAKAEREAEAAKARAAQAEVELLKAQLDAERAANAAAATRDSSANVARDQLQQRVKSLEITVGDLQQQLSTAKTALAAAEARAEAAAAASADPRGAKNAAMPDAVRQLYERERARQRRIQHDDADSADNGPKEISLYCPKDMQIGIADLGETERENNECMVLNLNGPGVSSRMVLFCDGTQHADGFEAEKEGGAGAGGKDEGGEEDDDGDDAAGTGGGQADGGTSSR